MCTVTFLPKGHSDFIITSNRDESRLRPTLYPAPYSIGNTEVYFPKDEQAGGTWFAVSKDYTVVLMNGAEHRHERKLPYRKSRGLVMLEFFEEPDPIEYWEHGEFDNIEPFTLVIAAHQNRRLWQFRWDGRFTDLEEKDASIPAIWSSSTLYEEPVRQQREEWFGNWLKTRQDFTTEEILHFHRFGGNGDANGLVMNRERVQTVSITSFAKAGNTGKLCYEDVVAGNLQSLDIMTL